MSFGKCNGDKLTKMKKCDLIEHIVECYEFMDMLSSGEKHYMEQSNKTKEIFNEKINQLEEQNDKLKELFKEKIYEIKEQNKKKEEELKEENKQMKSLLTNLHELIKSQNEYTKKQYSQWKTLTTGIDEYFNDGFVDNFIKDCLEFNKDTITPFNIIWNAYENWFIENHENGRIDKNELKKKLISIQKESDIGFTEINGTTARPKLNFVIKETTD